MSIISSRLPNCPGCGSQYVGVRSTRRDPSRIEHECMDCEHKWTTAEPLTHVSLEATIAKALAGWISGDPKVDLAGFSDDLDEVVGRVREALLAEYPILNRYTIEQAGC